MAVEEKFPNAKHIIDKFHVQQLLLKTLDEVRKNEQKESANKKAIFLGRRLFMIPEKRMSDKQKTALQSLSKQYPKTGRAYRIVSAKYSGNADFYEDGLTFVCRVELCKKTVTEMASEYAKE